MNPANENHEPTTIDDFHDRLVDRGLAEIAGRETVPNLRERILAALARGRDSFATEAPAPTVGLTSRKRVPTPSLRRAFWASLAVAAMLLVGAAFLLRPAVYSFRLAARASANKDASANSTRLVDRTQSVTLSGSNSGEKTKSEARGKLMVGTATSDDARLAGQRALDNTMTGNGALPFPYYESVNGREEDVLRALNRPVASDGAGTQAVKMLVTPRIIIQEGEEERLLLSDGRDKTAGLGTGPGLSGDQYTRIVENPFIKAEGGAAVSTFSIDVDTASYANVRQFLMQMNALPPPDAVRIEELVNYFDYDYAGPPADEKDANESAPFAAHVEVAGCPWAPEHRLVRIGIKGRELDRNQRPQSNLVFLVDVSGSMDEPAKLPLVVYGLQQLARELGENDRVAIVVYASGEGLVLPSTPGSNQQAILAALGQLEAGGSTAGGAGIQLAYQLAQDNFIQGGTNRVILCTDGDFNVGVTSTAELERLVEKKAKDTSVFLSVLGFGRGNLNDAMMEAISNHGNGNYHYVDNRTEARRVLVEEMTGTLVTIAKDVKIQVEFNPRQVAGYRLIGYENRMLRTEDFSDDRKDAGEIGAGHTVTALYEIVPGGKPVAVGPVDDLKYQQPLGRTILSVEDQSDEQTEDQTDKIVRPTTAAADIRHELLTLKMRYKQPEGDTSRKLEWPVTDDGKAFSAATGDFQFAAAVAGFGLLLRDSQYKGNLSYAAVLELAQGGLGSDTHGYRAELLDLVRRAQMLRGE